MEMEKKLNEIQRWNIRLKWVKEKKNILMYT